MFWKYAFTSYAIVFTVFRIIVVLLSGPVITGESTMEILILFSPFTSSLDLYPLAYSWVSIWTIFNLTASIFQILFAYVLRMQKSATFLFIFAKVFITEFAVPGNFPLTDLLLHNIFQCIFWYVVWVLNNTFNLLINPFDGIQICNKNSVNNTLTFRSLSICTTPPRCFCSIFTSSSKLFFCILFSLFCELLKCCQSNLPQ